MRAFFTPLFQAAAFLLSCSFTTTPPAVAGELSEQLAIVPWQVVTPGKAYRPAPLVVFWIPASAEDFRHSELLGFRPLLEFDRQCVSLQVIRLEDADRIAQLGAAGKLPMVVLAASDGRVLSRVVREGGLLAGAAVEKALRAELKGRQDAAVRDLDDAPKKLAIGDREGGIALFRRVCEQRCLLPRYAREAERALRKLGVPLIASAP